MFNEKFVAWDYSHPKSFRSAFVRGLTCILLLFIPMKAENKGAWAAMKIEIFPFQRRGKFSLARQSLFRVFKYRLKIMRRVAGEFCQRLFGGKTVFKII